RDRRRERVADVLEDHVPAPAAGPLLRGDGRGDRGAPAVRPGGHRRRPGGRPEQRADDRGPVPLQRRLLAVQLRLRRGRGADPLRGHLRRDAGPATAVRWGTVMVSDDQSVGTLPGAISTTATAPRVIGRRRWPRRLAYVLLVAYAVV